MKTIVYIDGQNFLYKAAEILIDKNLISDKQDLARLDIRSLFETLYPEENLEIRYYGVSKIRCREDYGPEIYEKSVRFSDNLRKIRNSLQNQNITYIPSGRLRVRDSDDCKSCGYQDYRFQEKGVDVGLAVDIVRDSIKNRVDRIILASSDSDLAPAIRAARQEGKEVRYVGFEGKLTHALMAETNGAQMIRELEVVEAYLRANQPKNVKKNTCTK